MVSVRGRGNSISPPITFDGNPEGVAEYEVSNWGGALQLPTARLHIEWREIIIMQRIPGDTWV